MRPPGGPRRRRRSGPKDFRWISTPRVAMLPSMKLIISPHNLKLTPAIEDHLVDRVEKLEKLNHRTVDVRVTLEHDTSKPTDRRFKCSIRLAVSGPDLFAEDYEGDLYAAIDLAAKKIEQQIRKRHNKFKARKQSEGAKVKRKRQDDTL
jgi:putative sigma-54 modulation protein